VTPVTALRSVLPLLIAAAAAASPRAAVPPPSAPTAVPPSPPAAVVRAIEAAVVAPAAVPDGTWTWPVLGPVIGAFEPPETPFGSGHRGIDVAVAAGTVVVAAEGGVVAFAGPVGGQLFVTVDHGGGLTSTYSWVSSLLVRRGDVVGEGMPIATSGRGHPGAPVPHLHFGVRQDDVYLDPMAFLGPLSVSDFIRLAPLAAA
jgi:murein DD-endopeptidase MepM/ murein hydrolase activator NlpD